jgi:hypothetical protein
VGLIALEEKLGRCGCSITRRSAETLISIDLRPVVFGRRQRAAIAGLWRITPSR